MRDLLGSTAFRWAGGIALWSVVLSLVLFAFIYRQTAAMEMSELDAGVRRELLYAAADPGRTAARIEGWTSGEDQGERVAGLFAPDGARLAGNLDAPPPGLVADGEVRGLHRPAAPTELRIAALRQPDGHLLVIAISTDDVEAAKATIRRALAQGLLPMLALSLLGGVVLAARARAKVGATQAAIAAIMRGDLRRRLPVAGRRDEFDRLSADVNAMLDRIETLLDEVRSVGDAIAHDLRTPLTRLRTRLERARSEARSVEDLQRQLDRSLVALDQALTLITAILRIGEIEHGRRRAAFAPVDLAAIAAAVVEAFEPLADEKGVDLEAILAPAAPRVLGDRDLLFEALANLVDNAVKFTPRGGAVRLRLGPEGDGLRLAVEDTGPGIPVAEREIVFRRFHRGEPARQSSGAGLGLSLVAAIVALHDFAIRIESPPGGGCRFVLDCPAPAPPAGAPREADASGGGADGLRPRPSR